MKAAAIFTIISSLFASTLAFAPVQKTFVKQSLNVNTLRQNSLAPSMPVSIQNQRYSMAQVQTMSLFGLGGPEIAIILIAGAFLLGPQKLAELGKDAGKIAGELKEVPKEFQKGLEEGEKLAQDTKKEITAEISSKKEE
mmetsp:Transcript_23430/g.34849  ORF Transcript_23430/g.34849 Transcript_23430/m.34849 type:complete len:139 (+) Transcript_23430:94-510(+)